MKKFFTLIPALFIVLAFCFSANAQTFYWTTTDKTLDGLYMNIRIVKTVSETAPTATSFGKEVSVSSGPFTSRGEAVTNCEKTTKMARKNGQMIKNLCGEAVNGK